MKFNRIVCDADSLLYRCGFAAEGEPVANACHSLKLQINSIKEALDCDNIELYISGQGNFREEIAVTCVYKGNRTGRKPSAYEELRDYMIRIHGAVPVNGMEADDLVSVELYRNRGKDSGVVLAAMDKDLWNTPGWHFNYDPKKHRIEYVSPTEADRNFLRQLLEGDRSDNVPGLPHCTEEIIEKYGLPQQALLGCGNRSSSALLSGVSGIVALDRVWEAYVSYGKAHKWDDDLIRAYFIEQGRLLWMTRELNEDGTPVLWKIPEKCSYWSLV